MYTRTNTYTHTRTHAPTHTHTHTHTHTQEAFKAIEEIHNLLGISGKAPKPGLLENFYMKQARVYWMANNRLFHAAAQHKLFVLRKEQKKTLTAEEAQR